MRADKTDLCRWPLGFDRLGHFAVVFHRRRGGIDDDVVEIFRNAEAFLDTDVMRRAIKELCARHQRGRLRQPSRVPKAGDFAAGLVAGPGAAIKAVETRRGEEECAHGFQ